MFCKNTLLKISQNLQRNTCDRVSFWRCSRPKVFCKEEVLENFAKFTLRHLCQTLFLNKVAGLRPATLLKKRLSHRWFPVNFAKFPRTPFLKNTSGGCFWIFKLTKMVLFSKGPFYAFLCVFMRFVYKNVLFLKKVWRCSLIEFSWLY